MNKFSPLSSEQLNSEIESFISYLDAEEKKCFGIQINQDAKDCQIFAPLLSYNLNNLGDPFTGDGGHLVTFNYEKELVLLVAGLLGLPADEAWGYYTPCSTISNLHGVHLGKRMSEESTLIISEEAHNSFEKAALITRYKKIVKIKTNKYGEISASDFENQIKRCNKEHYTIVFCSGTVAKGCYDDADKLLEILRHLNVDKSRYYLHIDAALGGMITPFLEGNPINLDFSLGEVDSLSVSFHKRLGIPIPGSLFLARKNKIDSLPFLHSELYAEHYSSYDTTIGGSRDGFSPFVTLMKLKKTGYEGMVQRTNLIIKKALWFVSLLNENGVDAWCHKYSPCVVLPAPSNKLIKEYHLPFYSSPEGNFTHIFTMEHVTEKAMEEFLNKYLECTFRSTKGSTKESHLNY
ncbi:MAG: pyridoxal-dependent decarboxylase [Deltaproteobacteria bacterium]|nr:pyridoxal-dependent decarboxylase [Deltaproteobacteria bacterium]